MNKLAPILEQNIQEGNMISFANIFILFRETTSTHIVIVSERRDKKHDLTQNRLIMFKII